MKKDEFIAKVNNGIAKSKKYMAVVIATDDMVAPEIIVNPVDNFDNKIKYYRQAYDDDMELISAKNTRKTIKIIDVLMINRIGDLNKISKMTRRSKK